MSFYKIANQCAPKSSAHKHIMDTLQDVSGGTKGLNFTNKKRVKMYMKTYISKVRNYETTLHLALQEDI